MPLGTLDSALLVRAAVAQGTDAHDAFICWLATRDLGQLPPGEFDLLPVLARRYEEDISRQPAAAKIIGAYRRSWYANQIALHGLRKALDTLTAADVPYLVVGDAAQALTVYSDFGARPIRVVSLLIPPAALDASMALLTAQGWRLASPTTSARHVWRTKYRLHQGHWAVLELSPHLAPDGLITAADADARTHTAVANVENVPAALADATALLVAMRRLALLAVTSGACRYCLTGGLRFDRMAACARRRGSI
ncbi:MAG: nucleotidyltransferase family protein [Anaerolineales bacterium]|nr:nucleotidyltransferase family protein [Anaerolineales bacterium]